MKLRKFFFIFFPAVVIILIIFLNKNLIFKSSGPFIVLSTGTIHSGDILNEVLSNAGLEKSEVTSVLVTLNPYYNIRNIQPGHIYEIYHTTFGIVNKFNYWYSPVEYFSVEKSTEGKFYCSKKVVPSKKLLKNVEGELQTTLWEAMTQKGINPEMIMNFADIFSWQIDFFTEPRVGDKFKFIYESYEYENNVKIDGKILGAIYDGKQTGKYIAVFFESQDKKYSDYFSSDGASLKKMFLRAPLNFRRISSYFSYNRFHPILRYWRPHLGIDYAAPTGTPVSSIGDGTVIFVGWEGGFGNLVKIRHNSTYTTWYGHLSRFGKGIKKGVRVRQGQVIGYVGATGLATGPHLDFRITKNGSFVNFLKLKFPPSQNVPKEYKEEFEKTKEEILKLLEGTAPSS